MPGVAELIEQLSPHQMDLSLIHLRRPHSGDKSVSDVFAGMRVAFHAVIFDKSDGRLGRFAKPVLRVT